MLHGGVILAGGRGQRLMPLTSKTPKPLLSVGGKTPFERCVKALTDSGIKNVAVTTGYLGEELENISFPYANVTFYREEEPKGTSGAVFPLIPYLAEDFFVLSGDCVFDFPLFDMMEYHKEKNAAVTIATVTSSDPTQYGTLLSEDGEVLAFLEKPSWKQVVTTGINAGIYIINRKVFEKFEENHGRVSDFSSDFFPALLKDGEKIASFETKGFWCDMGTVESFLSSNMHFSKGENVIGDYVSIGKDTKIEKSVIMNGVKVGSGTVIRNSVIAEGVAVGKNCFLENATVGADTLICDGVTLGKGCTVDADTIIGKGKTLKSPLIEKLSFYDSGKIKIPKDEKSLSFFGEALANISCGRDILFFCDGDVPDTDIVRQKAKEKGARVSKVYKALLPVASFCASRKDAYSVFAKEEFDVITFSVFDFSGLPLSREEQLKIEKYSKGKNRISVSQEDAPDFNPTEEYAKEKIQHLNDLSGISASISANENLKNMFEKILEKKGGILDSENGNYRFFINDSCEDVYCLTKEGKKIDKTRLFSIIISNEPPVNIPIPDFLPEEIKTLLSKSGGGFSLYGDTFEGRASDSEAYSYSDGISIALFSLHVCAKTKSSLSDLDSLIPPFSFFEKTVDFFGNKGKAAESLYKKYQREKNQFIISRKEEKGMVSLVPQYEKAFRIFASALSQETAEELLALAEEEISSLDQK